MSSYTIPIPTYQCHKRVQALKIKAVLKNPRGYELHYEDERFVPREVSESWVVKCLPGDKGYDHLIGGYVVWYEDGYVSWSPAAAFEAGYTAVASDQEIEQEIQHKGLTAPRITPEDIETNIAQENYFTAWDGAERVSHHRPDPALKLLTFCVLVLRNGFTVTGESACASPANFDAEIGKKIARQNAVQKIWPLMGYALKERLSGGAA